MQSSFEKNKWILSLLLIIVAMFLSGYLFNSPKSIEPLYVDQGVIQSKVTENWSDPKQRRYVLYVKCRSGITWKVYMSEKIHRKYNSGDAFLFNWPQNYTRF